MTRSRPSVPPLLLAAGYAGLVAAVALHWGSDKSAADRYLILAGAGYLFATRWKESSADPTPRPLAGLLLMALGALAYPLAWAGYFVLVNARTLPLWTLWLALFLATGGWVLARYGGRAAYRLAFPLLFVAFALPPPDILLQPFRSHLQAATTSVSEVALRTFGYPVTRPGGGFILTLPGGDLGVEEACSGIKALTALTAVAAFTAFWRRFGVARGVLLVVAAVPVVILVNVLRVTLSGVIQEAAGPHYIRDGWHEALGFATVLIGLGVVYLVARVLAPRGGVETPAAVEADAVPAPRWLFTAAAAVLTVGLALTAAAVWHGRTLVASPVETPPLSDLAKSLDGWGEPRDLPVRAHVSEALEADVIVHREYRTPLGQVAFVWVIYWNSLDSMPGYHHPDICLPRVGYKERNRGVETIEPGGGAVPMTSRTLAGPTAELYVLYWAQTGRKVWGPAEEEEAKTNSRTGRALARGFARWTDPTPPEPTGRLVVLIGSPNTTEFGREQVRRFARAVAEDVYRLCPSAASPIPPAP